MPGCRDALSTVSVFITIETQGPRRKANRHFPFRSFNPRRDRPSRCGGWGIRQRTALEQAERAAPSGTHGVPAVSRDAPRVQLGSAVLCGGHVSPKTPPGLLNCGGHDTLVTGKGSTDVVAWVHKTCQMPAAGDALCFFKKKLFKYSWKGWGWLVTRKPSPPGAPARGGPRVSLRSAGSGRSAPAPAGATPLRQRLSTTWRTKKECKK